MKTLFLSMAAVAASLWATTSAALAQFTALTSQGASHLVGVSTSGSETGIYEVAAQHTTMLTVIIGMVIAVVSFMVVRRLFFKA